MCCLYLYNSLNTISYLRPANLFATSNILYRNPFLLFLSLSDYALTLSFLLVPFVYTYTHTYTQVILFYLTLSPFYRPVLCYTFKLTNSVSLFTISLPRVSFPILPSVSFPSFLSHSFPPSLSLTLFLS